MGLFGRRAPAFPRGCTRSLHGSGEQCLTEALVRNRELPSPTLLPSIVREIQQFSRDEQHDDATLVVAKCCS